jgi:hypothetical protein
MKRPADYTNTVTDTLNRGAGEARELLQQTATVLENEWKRLMDNVEESSTLPDQVKTAVNRLDGAVGDVRGFVAENGPRVVNEGVRRARDLGVPVPDDWAVAETDADTATDAADSDTVEASDTVEDAVLVDEAETDAVDEVETDAAEADSDAKADSAS